jgi:MFS family permease
MNAAPSPPPSTAAGRRSLGRVLINRNFALLWAGETISVIGDATFAVTLVLWVTLVIARGQPWTPLAVSGVLLATISPELLIAPFAGVFADRWNKRRTMLAMDAARALLIILLLLATGAMPLPFLRGGQLSGTWQLGLIYGVVFLASACSQFFNPSMFALIAALVAEPERAHASGLRQGSSSLAAIIGPSLAALLFFRAGIGWALLLNALSFVVSCAAVLAVRVPTTSPNSSPTQQEPFLREFAGGLRFYFGNRVLVTLLVAGVLTLLGFGTLNTLDIFFVTENLRAAPSVYGILTSLQGVGLIAGAAATTLLARRIGAARIFGCSLVAWGITILVYARMTTVAPAIALMCVTGVLLSAAQIAETPLFMHDTPHELLGRVYSIFAPAISAAELVGIGLSGYLASTTLRHFHATVLGVAAGPVDTIFSAVGLSILAAGVYALVSLRQLTLRLGSRPAGSRDRRGSRIGGTGTTSTRTA